MRDDLLWVYEGMTQYWGYVLTARSGMRTAAQTRDLFALDVANFDISPGREWRPLVDTTNQPTVSQRSAVSWVSWQRPEDYYTEGMLIWLDADTKIRELSGDTKSLDDFCKLFFAIDNGSYVTRTYNLQDVVSTLNKVQPFEWAQFLQTRVYNIAPHTPGDGITRGGYKLVYNDTPIDWLKKGERPDSFTSFSTSVGFSVKKDGELGNVWWNSPAFKAGITPDMQITAVNGESFTTDKLKSAITAAEKSNLPITFLLKQGDEFQTISIPYHDGLRYPHLERADGTPDRIGVILSPAK
jgi:predicted metalloprotease with PDZ domain